MAVQVASRRGGGSSGANLAAMRQEQRKLKEENIKNNIDKMNALIDSLANPNISQAVVKAKYDTIYKMGQQLNENNPYPTMPVDYSDANAESLYMTRMIHADNESLEKMLEVTNPTKKDVFGYSDQLIFGGAKHIASPIDYKKKQAERDQEHLDQLSQLVRTLGATAEHEVNDLLKLSRDNQSSRAQTFKNLLQDSKVNLFGFTPDSAEALRIKHLLRKQLAEIESADKQRQALADTVKDKQGNFKNMTKQERMFINIYVKDKLADMLNNDFVSRDSTKYKAMVEGLFSEALSELDKKRK